jgi:uncharacterized protein (DUF305 family)
MKPNGKTVIAAVAFIIALASWNLSAADQEKSAEPPAGLSASDSVTDKLKPLQGKEFETAFLKEMIQHHQMAIQMAKLAQSRAARPEIKQMAQKSISDQSKQVKEMTEWLKQWYSESPGRMDMEDPSMQKTMDQIDKLKQAKGEEFDKLFLTSMPEHHQQGIRMARLAEERAQHPEVKQLAGQIAQGQRAEIQKMESWKATGR